MRLRCPKIGPRRGGRRPLYLGRVTRPAANMLAREIVLGKALTKRSRAQERRLVAIGTGLDLAGEPLQFVGAAQH